MGIFGTLAFAFMGKTKGVLLGIVVTIFIFFVVFFMVGYFQPKAAEILIESNPASNVFINENMVGRTPFKQTMEEGEVIVRLIPDSQNMAIEPFETRVKLTGGIQTVIKRDFAQTEEFSSGIIMSFEKTSKKQTSLAVVSIPDTSQVQIDGIVSGFTPFKTENILPGNHTLTISAPKFVDGSYDLKTYEGYKLTAFIKLAPDTSKAEEKEEKKEVVVEVEILDTPTGFLRVRKEPSTSAPEVAQVKPGEKYLLLDEDQDSGWLKIEIEDEEGEKAEGWVSGEYSKKIESEDGEVNSSDEE